MNRCMTPWCPNYAPPDEVLCVTCRELVNNTAFSSAYLPFLDYDGYPTDRDPDLSTDLAAVAGWLVKDQNEREAVIHRQQDQLNAQAQTINDLGHRLDHRLREVDYERARADGLQQQVDGLRTQLWALGIEPVQSAPNGHRKSQDPKRFRFLRRLLRV